MPKAKKQRKKGMFFNKKQRAQERKERMELRLKNRREGSPVVVDPVTGQVTGGGKRNAKAEAAALKFAEKNAKRKLMPRKSK